MNTQNLVILEGRLAAEPTYSTHADGSKTVFLKMAVRDNFKSKNVPLADGTVGEGYATQFISAQGFVSATPKNAKYPNGVYTLLEKGMRLSIAGHMAGFCVKDGATDKDGNTVNRWGQCIRIDNVQILETAGEKAVRQSNQAKKAAPAATAAPVAPSGVAESYEGYEGLEM